MPIDENPAPRRGVLYYDGSCRFCIGTKEWLAPVFEPRGIAFLPFEDGSSEEEMVIVKGDGSRLGGAEAVRFLAGLVWWGWPFWLLLHVPGAMIAAQWIYRGIAKRRHCLNGACLLPGPGKRSSHD